MHRSGLNFKSSTKALLFLEYFLTKVLLQIWETNSGKVIQLHDHFKIVHVVVIKMPIAVLHLVGIKPPITFLL